MDKEDKIQYEAWMEIGKDPIVVPRKKDKHSGGGLALYFHEQIKFKPHDFESDQSDMSLQKRWGFIQVKCIKFCGAHEQVTKRP
jgi:hypothetical protein